jgi:hypothetical protein
MRRKLTQQEHDDLAVHGQISAETIAYAIDSAVARATAWQPIETLLAMHVGLNDLIMFDQNVPDGGVFIGNCDNLGRFWYSSGDYFDQPTHWIPLPKPPVTE